MVWIGGLFYPLDIHKADTAELVIVDLTYWKLKALSTRMIGLIRLLSVKKCPL